MVRLKETTTTKTKKVEDKFQFLMVRLKVLNSPNARPYCDISIPYGAIKRSQARFRILLPVFISIPYGAIKSR